MKEVSFKLYEFDELSDESRKKVIERKRYSVGEESAQSYSEDWAASLEEFEKIILLHYFYLCFQAFHF